MVAGMSRDESVARLVRAGELWMSGENPDEIRAAFSPEFTFHAPGVEIDYDGLAAYFQSLRNAFDNRKITRGIVVVEDNHIACQTTIEGDFVREFTQSPVAAPERTAHRVRADQHLPLRRRRPDRRRVRADRQPQRASAARGEDRLTLASARGDHSSRPSRAAGARLQIAVRWLWEEVSTDLGVDVGLGAARWTDPLRRAHRTLIPGTFIDQIIARVGSGRYSGDLREGAPCAGPEFTIRCGARPRRKAAASNGCQA
jgi:hypothetical protein